MTLLLMPEIITIMGIEFNPHTEVTAICLTLQGKDRFFIDCYSEYPNNMNQM